ncbi:hypothetical protein PY32053_03278 [Paracoccus yeei]|uniref:ABC3 transporter permease C-terminal domain-containing protein n=1 Tax=Paracoccus yeei TaxID=147645 RepID=A0A386USF5_9RHOB|nr:FtsX-like permease family protein [Paracoccus yeei]AYF02852.1 hypothetical protein PY32053_03278 [Paracoccus yeei]
MTGLLPLRLALAELRHARIWTLCQVIGLAALLLPLLILFGIKNGVIADRTAALLQDPEALRITIARTGSYPAALITELSADPDVRFVAPHPIRLAVMADFAAAADASRIAIGVTLLASGADDPYLPAGLAPPRPGEAVISAPLAGQLGLTVGDRVDALLRPGKDAPDGAVLGFTISGVTEAGTWARVGALLHRDDLFLIQDWTHGAVALAGTDLGTARGTPRDRDDYPSLRLYAANADAAAALMQRLAARGIATGGTPQQAGALIFLRNALDAGFATVAVVGLVGVTASFAANLWTAVIRNRRAISLLRLAGLGQGGAVLFPLAQALAIGLVGWVLAIGFYAALTGVLDRLLGETFGVGQQVARLTWVEYTASAVATLTVSGLAAIWAAFAITRISPEEGFNDAP